MILSTADSARFHRIWRVLLNYVNTQCKLVERRVDSHGAAGFDSEDAMKIRDVLWRSPDLLDQFIASNPEALSAPDLELAASWRYRCSGQFVILRYLKKHSIFLRYEEQPRVFGVLGITSPLQEVVGHSLPVMVETVLLPFEGKIIYDGLISPYQFNFGPALRNRFSLAYRKAQEAYGVKTSLQQEEITEPPLDAIDKDNQTILLAFRNHLIGSGLGDKKLEEHYSAVERFANTPLPHSNGHVPLPEISVNALENFFSAGGRKAHGVSLRRFVRFLLNADKIDEESAMALLAFLKAV